MRNKLVLKKLDDSLEITIKSMSSIMGKFFIILIILILIIALLKVKTKVIILRYAIRFLLFLGAYKLMQLFVWNSFGTETISIKSDKIKIENDYKYLFKKTTEEAQTDLKFKLKSEDKIHDLGEVNEMSNDEQEGNIEFVSFNHKSFNNSLNLTIGQLKEINNFISDNMKPL